MKKKVFLMLPCVAAVAIALLVGKSVIKSNAENDSLLMQNVEALTAGADPQVDNGYILKANPIFTKMCYRHYVDITRVKRIQIYDPDTNGYVYYEAYYNSYHAYERKDCRKYKVDGGQYLPWWPNCDRVGSATCDFGDVDEKPVPFEYWG